MPQSILDIIIVEDELDSQEYLIDLLDRYPQQINVIGAARSVSEGVALLRHNSPSIVFMDIQLIDGSSFDILAQLERIDFEIIFVTAFDHFYEKAFEHFAFSYLLKPIDQSAVHRVLDEYSKKKSRIINQHNMQHLRSLLQQNDSKILIQVGHDYESLRLDSIIKAEADGNFTKFFCVDNEQYYASKSLKYYFSILKFKDFIKTNRFSIINLNHIKTIKKRETILMSNGDKIAISSHYKHNVEELFPR